MIRIEIVATGPELIKYGVRSFESVLEEMIDSAQREILAVSYVISTGAFPIIKRMVRAAERGVRVSVVINSLQDTSEEIRNYITNNQKRLQQLFRVTSFRDIKGYNIHAKVVVVDRRKVVVGSANLSWRGIAENYEIGIVIEGEPAWKIAGLIEELIEVK